MDDAKNTWEARKEAENLPVLGALCLFLSVVEYMLPKPLPFIRLGLANAPLLLALRLPPSAFFTLVLVKIFGQAFISGTLFSYVFLLSLSGTAFSASVMYVLRLAAPEKYISLVGISVSGAVVSNIIQITLARLFILGPGAMYIVPPVLGMGIVSGAALGMFCERFAAGSRWYRGDAVEEDADFTPPRARAAGSGKKVLFDTEKLPPEPLFFAGVFMSAAMLFTNGLFIRAALFFVFFSAAALAGKCGNLLRTFAFFFVVAVFNALAPYGRVLFEAGFFSLTEGGIARGIEKAATVEGLIMLSRVTISPRLRLPGKAGALLSEAFRLLPRLYEKKNAVHAKTFIGDIDKILLELTCKTR